MRILESENYYNVINGYKEPFLEKKATSDTSEVYKAGTTFEEVYALYTFDRELKIIFLKALLKVENSFKTVIAHTFSSKYGHNNYLKVDNFDNADKKSIFSAIKLIGDIQQEIARQMSKHHPAITHYMTNHGYIPLWVLVNVLTFGKIANFYRNMKEEDKIIVAKHFSLQPRELAKFMKMLTLARNICAHNERFYRIRFREYIHTKSIKNFSVLGIMPAADKSYVRGTNDAYALTIMLALLLNKSDVKEFISSLRGAFSKMEKQLHTVSASAIMNIMGFNENWENLARLK